MALLSRPVNLTEQFTSLTGIDPGLTVYLLGYDGTVEVTSSTPSYGSKLSISGNNLGFWFAASIVLPELYDAIADYRTDNILGQPIAVAEADIVAHSMGGDVTRELPARGDFARFENYEKGPIHKLITIGTPHLGSPLALSNNPLAKALTSSGWPTIVGSQSDAIVPVNSQLAGTLSTEFPLGAEVHSPGTEDLGFAGPSELDDTSVISSEVLTLLNTPVDTESEFLSLP